MLASVLAVAAVDAVAMASEVQEKAVLLLTEAGLASPAQQNHLPRHSNKMRQEPRRELQCWRQRQVRCQTRLATLASALLAISYRSTGFCSPSETTRPSQIEIIFNFSTAGLRAYLHVHAGLQ